MAASASASCLRPALGLSNEMRKAVIIIIGLGLLAFGPLALLFPETAASLYGIPADTPEPRAYLFAAATRDVAIGCLLFALLGLRANSRILAASVFAISVVAAADAANVIAHTGWRGSNAPVIHVGGLCVLLAVGCWLWRAPAGSDD